MRSLLMLLILGGFIWLICRFFYSLGKKDAIKGQKRKDKASATRRKKVESFVIENENRSSCGDDKQ
jgi:hypothetical protein